MSLRPAALLASPDPNDHGNGEHMNALGRNNRAITQPTLNSTQDLWEGPCVAHTRGEASLREGPKAIGHASESGPSETQMTRAWRKVKAFFTNHQSERRASKGTGSWRVTSEGSRRHTNTKQTPWNSQKTHQTDPNHPPSGERVFVKQREREEERKTERGGECLHETNTNRAVLFLAHQSSWISASNIKYLIYQDALNGSKVTVKSFIMLQKIPI